jgi:hypothetical protein
MTNNYSVSKDYRYRSHLFKIWFLVAQLLLCGAVLFYILKKHEIGLGLITAIVR